MAAEKSTTVRYFNHRAGFFPALGYGIELLCGQKKMGATDNGDLVQTSLIGNPKKVGEKLLGLYDRDRKKLIERNFGKPTHTIGDGTSGSRRELYVLEPTQESLERIDLAVEEEPVREIIKEELQKYAPQNLRFEGELLRLDIYKLENPENHGGAKYVIAEKVGVMTSGEGYSLNRNIRSYTPEGEIVRRDYFQSRPESGMLAREYKALAL